MAPKHITGLLIDPLAGAELVPVRHRAGAAWPDRRVRRGPDRRRAGLGLLRGRGRQGAGRPAAAQPRRDRAGPRPRVARRRSRR